MLLRFKPENVVTDELTFLGSESLDLLTLLSPVGSVGLLRGQTMRNCGCSDGGLEVAVPKSERGGEAKILRRRGGRVQTDNCEGALVESGVPNVCALG